MEKLQHFIDLYFVIYQEDFNTIEDEKPNTDGKKYTRFNKIFFRYLVTKVSSKLGVYEFLMSSQFQLVTECLLFLSITRRLSMVESLYLYSAK
jgi:hypothetical protein